MDLATFVLNEEVATVSETTIRAGEELRRTAMAVSVHFKEWGTQKALTKAQQQRLASTFNARVKAVRGNKTIVNRKNVAFSKVTAVLSAARKYYKGITLPYVEDGIRLLKRSDFGAFRDKVTDFSIDLYEAVTRLQECYDDLIQESVAYLGDLHDPGDYPDSILDQFAITYEVRNVEPPTYLMQLDPEAYRSASLRAAAAFDQSVERAVAEFAGMFGRMVSELAERLKCDDKGQPLTFHRSRIDNLISNVRNFHHLNVTNNRQLEEAVNRIEALIQNSGVETLRSDHGARERTRIGLEEIQTTLESMAIPKKRRTLNVPQ